MHRTLLCFLLMQFGTTLLANDDQLTPIILDTDIGTEIDDPFALAYAAHSKQLELVAVTTVTGDTTIRAKMALRLLFAIGKTKVPVAAGAAPQPKNEITGQYPYYYHPHVLYNRAGQPAKHSAVELMAEKLKQRPGEITIVATGPLTNIARLLKEHPESAQQIKRIVVMGGSINRDYEGKEKATAEWNIKTDAEAAKRVLGSGVPITLVPLDATWDLKLEAKEREQFFAAQSMTTLQVEALYQMWGKEDPVLFDPAAVALVRNEGLAKYEELRLEVRDDGLLRKTPGEANVRVALSLDQGGMLKEILTVASDAEHPSKPRELKNETKLIDDNRFPARVHVFEDFETDIEKRWWLSGKVQTENVPSGSKRACASRLTLDFDDLQGQLDTMYSAVVFNPVPGPPMGPKTRLKFRYYLEGTDELRVQIYSLSNGYHRYLSVKGLPQQEWREATVDMTAARRPDGSGGALANDERIDDIQFYVVPRAKVLIDDIVLYDAGEETEKRPFPKRILFTGWFDTGKQGVEWPGEFKIVEHEKPRTWKAAQSMVKEEGQPQVLTVSLRGLRPLEEKCRVEFKYKLDGKLERGLTLALMHSKEGKEISATLAKPQTSQWSQGAVEFSPGDDLAEADQLRFVLPAPGVTLAVDDVLIYEP